MLALAHVYVSIIVGLCVLCGRILYLVFLRNGEKSTKRARSRPAKTMIILGSGGHTAEMLRIVKHLDFNNYSPRLYIHARTDKISPEKAKELEQDNADYRIVAIYRSREVRQSYVTSVWTTVVAILDSVPLLWREKAELILCNGPGTCVPLCVVAFVLNVFWISRAKIVFVESFCRVKTLSLTGKILYYIADHIIVQWPYLSGSVYKRSTMRHEASVISKLVPWESLTEDLKRITREIKVYAAPMVHALRASHENQTNLSLEWIDYSAQRIEACIDRTWEALNSGHWKDVPMEHRYCYSLCCVVQAALLEIQYDRTADKDEKDDLELLKTILGVIDKGILLGAPLPSAPDLLPTIASRLNDRYHKESLKEHVPGSHVDNDNEIPQTLLPGLSAVSSYVEPSMETFYRDIFKPKVPALLHGCIKHWRALESWKDLDYLNRIAGSRTVPIEIGSRYTEEDWSQRLVKFSEFVQEHIIKKDTEVGYLAQHQLFEQIPELKSDIVVPDYCNFSDNEEPEQPDVNAWFGPGSTVSPLHHDPKNNLLCQVVGHKKVILYSPDDTTNLYPYDNRLLDNTAQVDPINPDYDKWPKFREAKGLMCYLKPGDMLYIPPKWWHHVSALTTSFSVSFWWN